MNDRFAREASNDARNDHERFDEWDAAYVLGALTPADRRAYEDHLASCPICSAQIGELAGMPGLLGTLSAEEATGLLEAESPQAPDLVSSLLHRVKRRRRMRRWSLAGALVAAAAVAAAVALVVPSIVSEPPAASFATSLQPPAAASSSKSPLTASVTLTAKKWGTSIGMVCDWKADSSWSPDAGGTSRWEYALWAIARDGTSDRVATWYAGPGDVVHASGATSIQADDIDRIELRATDTGAVLLAAPVHATAKG